MKIRREDSVITGGMRALRGRAGFDRAPLVLEYRGERYIVRRIGHGEEVEGEPMNDAEWRGVLASEEALELATRYPAMPDASLWLLRRNFSFRDTAMDTLKHRGAVLYEESHDDALVLLVDESAASGLTDQWTGHAWNEAWAHARAARLSQAVEDAELAMSLARGFLEEHVAFLSLLYEREGDKDRAEAILEFARNSRGNAFYQRACEKKARFAGELRELSTVSASAPRRQRFAPKVYPRRKHAVSDSLGFHARNAA